MSVIQAESFILRPFQAADAMPLMVRMNTKAIDKYTTIDLPWTMEFSLWWIDFITQQAKQKPLSEIHWVIEIEGHLAGAVGIINIEDGEGELGYWLDERYWSQGVMTKAIAKVTEYGLKKLKLKRIFAPVLPYNKGSMRVLEKNGYQLEEVRKDHFEKKGQMFDAHFFGVRG